MQRKQLGRFSETSIKTLEKDIERLFGKVGKDEGQYYIQEGMGSVKLVKVINKGGGIEVIIRASSKPELERIFDGIYQFKRLKGLESKRRNESMKVKELIKQLQKLPQEKDIVITSMDDRFYCDDFELHSFEDSDIEAEIILPYYFDSYTKETDAFNESRKKRNEEMYVDKEVIDAWNFLEDYDYFTHDELMLVTDINGFNIDTLNDCIYARYGYHDVDQLKREDHINESKQRKNELSDDVKRKVFAQRKADFEKAKAKLNKSAGIMAKKNISLPESVKITFTSGFCETEEDDYEQGLVGGRDAYWDNHNQRKTITLDLTKPDFIKYLAAEMGEFLYCYWIDEKDINFRNDDDGDFSLGFSTMGDENNEEPSDTQFDNWKKGLEKLWNIDGYIDVEVSETDKPFLIEALKKAGVQEI